MLRNLRTLLAIGVLCATLPLLARAADDKDGMVSNPQYSAWAGHKVGATVTVSEKTTYSTNKGGIPDEKMVTYTLLSVTDAKVVVRAVVVERELLGYVESAPTKHHYPAKLKKSYLAVAAPELNAKAGEDTIKWKDAELKCKTMTGSYKKDGDTVEFKVWSSDKVPGGIVIRTRTLKGKEDTISTRVTLVSYSEMAK